MGSCRARRRRACAAGWRRRSTAKGPPAGRFAFSTEPMTHFTQHRPLRICIVVPYDLSIPGGGVKHHALQLAHALRTTGDQVTVLGPASEPVDLPGAIGLPGVVKFVSNGAYFRMGLLIAPWRVRRFFRENRFDV